MAITQGLCNSYKYEIMKGLHLAAHDYYLALYTSNATMSATNSSYLAANESTGGGYVAGGAILAGFNATDNASVAILDFTDWALSTATIKASGAMIYNNTLAGKNSVCILAFGSSYAASNGSFTIQFPAPVAATALIRIT